MIHVVHLSNEGCFVFIIYFLFNSFQANFPESHKHEVFDKAAPVSALMFILIVDLFISFAVLRRFQHCTGHITMGSCKGRGNQYMQFVRVLYCKLPTNGKQLPAFPLEAVP